MKRILIEYFKDIDNYGTGMMGLVTVQAFADRYGVENVEFHCDFRDPKVLMQVQSELPAGIKLVQYRSPDSYTAAILSPLKRKLHRLWHLIFSSSGKGFDMVVVLGGDDLSEYYSKYAPAIALLKKWHDSLHTRVILLGQTIGPFTLLINRLVARYALPRLEVYSRDENSARYLADNFGVKSTIMADLAIQPLPLQSDTAIKQQVLTDYALQEGEYATVVVSGCQSAGKYYCRSEHTYLKRFAQILALLVAKEQMNGKKIVLLAHTFGRHGDEAQYINRLMAMLDPDLRARVVAVTEMIMPTRARHIIGGGVLTITGRMHAAVSTFQMGSLAISLSYSIKYAGVIGQSLGRGDLIIEANKESLWETGEITELVDAKIDYIFANYNSLRNEVLQRVMQQQQLITATLDSIIR